MLLRPNGIVSLLTDFGLRDPYVGVMRGVVLQHHRRAVLVDLGHGVPPQDVEAGALWLASALGRFPPGTVHVAVVDPGVGGGRRALAARAGECYWVAPDNGLLTHVLRGDDGAEVRAIDPVRLGLHGLSATFHGRDVFAPVAGWLSGGRYGFSSLGPRVEDPVLLPPIEAGDARVVRIDGFGNLVTNVRAERLVDRDRVVLGGRSIPIVRTYSEVSPGSFLALIGSDGWLEIAVREGHAAEKSGLGVGTRVELPIRR